jgi:hypothetical protein
MRCAGARLVILVARLACGVVSGYNMAVARVFYRTLGVADGTNAKRARHTGNSQLLRSPVEAFGVRQYTFCASTLFSMTTAPTEWTDKIEWSAKV